MLGNAGGGGGRQMARPGCQQTGQLHAPPMGTLPGEGGLVESQRAWPGRHGTLERPQLIQGSD